MKNDIRIVFYKAKKNTDKTSIITTGNVIGSCDGAFQVHRWIRENTDAPGLGYIHHLYKSELEKLKQDCLDVLNNKDLAEKVLPIPSACKKFFGLSYDTDYFNTLKEMVRGLTYILETTDFEKDNVYCSERIGL